MGLRFNPPPGWPPPPEGFVPPPGWQPDPSWPPYPPGWAFWVPDDAPQATQTADQPAAPDQPATAGQWAPPGQWPGQPQPEQSRPEQSRPAQSWPAQPPPAGQPPWPYVPQDAQPRTNGFAIASLVLGLFGLFLFLLGSVLGIVFGIVALVQIRTRPPQRGKGLAIAGIAVSCLWIALFIAALLAIFFTSPPNPAAVGSGLSPSQLSPAQARAVFGSFLAAFTRAQPQNSAATARTLMTGPELEVQNLVPFSGPLLGALTDVHVYVPRLSGYPHWFIATGHLQSGGADFLFLLTQAAPGKHWLDATELYGFGQPALPNLSGVVLDAQGYAAAVPSGDKSLAVPPADLSAGFARYFDAAVGQPGGAPGPVTYSNGWVAPDLTGKRLAPRYGWHVADVLRPVSARTYALRLAGGGAAVIFLTQETYVWQARSAAAALSAPQSVIGNGAVPPPTILQYLHVRSVRPGERIVDSIVDEHIAIDPPPGGTVADFFNGKPITWAKT